MILPLPVRIGALTGAAAAVVWWREPPWANSFSDLVLALAAGLVAGRFLQGYERELRAEKTSDPAAKADLEESAKTLYSRNSLQSPLLLHIAFFGCALKAVAICWLPLASVWRYAFGS